MANFLAIKFHQPAPPPQRITRPLIVQRLNEGLENGRPMTLVSAPAGFGKTTCVSEWLADLALPVAWLSLDGDDNDPGRFFTYLGAALKKVSGDREAFSQITEVERVLSSGQLPPLEVITAALTADILEYPGRFVLVLDDFHLIQERFILKVFEKLVSNLFQAPLAQPLHLVLLTREDPSLPLARLRANNRLTEVRASDLRFSADEAGRFLNEVMNLSLSPAEVATLEDRTEGWVVGLQLAGLSIRGRSDASRFIASLSGNQRFILSYLTEEVLNRQPEEIQSFLLQTSILDKLCADLCDAVIENGSLLPVLRSPSSQSILETLERSNLFLIPLDDEGRWYRYHHLFADLLRSRQAVLQGEKTAELHRRASRWFARAREESAFGEPAALIAEAVQHALAGADYGAAVELIEAHAMDMLMRWYARTVTDWMHALPPEWSAHSPWTNLAFARMHLIRGSFTQAGPYLERLEALFSAPQDRESGPQLTPAFKAEWLALQSSICSTQGKAAEALELAKHALDAAPEKDANAQSQAYLALAAAYQKLDDPSRAEEAFQRVIELGRASGNIITELTGVSSLALMVIERGQLRYGFELAAQGAERAERSGSLPPICAGIYGELGQVSYLWRQLDQAEQYFQRSAQVSMLSGFSDAEIYHAVFRSRLSLARGDVDAAAREIQKAADIMRADAPVVVREEVIAQQVTVFLAQCRLSAAEQILSNANYSIQGQYSLPDLAPGQTIAYTQGVLYISALRILLYRARIMSDPHLALQGIEFAGRLLEYLRQRSYISLALETLLLRAQLYTARGDLQGSQADIAAALELAEPEGYISVFVAEGEEIRLLIEDFRLKIERSRPGLNDYLDRLLAAFPVPAGTTGEQSKIENRKSKMVEALTDRELEVLRLVTAGRTYEEIAGELVVSINTVRTHIKSIYGKLGVNNRTAAIEAAREMDLL